MAVLDLANQLAEAWLEGQREKRYGPNYRQKMAQGEAELAQTRAQTRAVESGIEQNGVQTEGMRKKNEQLDLELGQMKSRLQKLQEAHAQGLIPTADLEVARGIYEAEERRMKREAHAAGLEQEKAQTGLIKAQTGAVANRAGAMNLTGAKWVTTPQGRRLVTRSGEFVDEIEGTPIGPPPTADQINAERFDVIIPTHLKQLQTALDKVKTEGTGAMSYLSPQGYRTRAAYNRLVQALAASAARAMGDSRISDTDRAAYASLYGISSQLVGIEPGAETAQQLLDQAVELFQATQQKRKESMGVGNGQLGMDEVATPDSPPRTSPKTEKIRIKLE